MASNLVADFNELRASLKPAIDTWKTHLQDVWTKIRTIQNENERLAFIIEYNKFKDLHKLMDHIVVEETPILNPHSSSLLTAMTTNEIKKNIQNLYRINEALKIKDAPLENIGTTIIDTLIKPVEECLETSTSRNKIHKRIWCVRTLNKAIKLTKQAKHELIPHNIYTDIISRINTCILCLNEYMFGSFGKGVLLQLARESECQPDGTTMIYHVAIIYKLKCEDCGATHEIYTSMYEDVYAPRKCKECKSHRIVKDNGNYCGAGQSSLRVVP